MNRALEHIEPLRTHLIPVPGSPQLGVCQTCHGGCSFDYPRCFKCNEMKKRGFEIELLPISLSIHGGLLHDHLFQYKNPLHSGAAALCESRLAALTSVFFSHHSQCIGDFDSITPVPSSKRAAPLLIAQKVIAIREYRFEATPAGCRVSETWTDRRASLFKRFIKMKEVPDRDAYTVTSIRTTLENLKASLEATAS